jgi:hypothetical protein
MTISLPSGADQTIDILYDGSGRKLQKTVKDAGVLLYTQDYVGGIEYRTTTAVSLSLESIGHGGYLVSVHRVAGTAFLRPFRQPTKNNFLNFSI